MKVDPLEAVFKNLDRWRHLPSYQLERRADILFSVYLKGIVEERMGIALEDDMIPELPLKRDVIWPHKPSNQSVKVDYALFAKDRSRVYFVELKTDAGSRRDTQDDYLARAKELGFRRIVEGVRAILLETNAHQKYHHLAVALARQGFLVLPDDLASYVHPAPRPGLSAALRRIEVAPIDPPVEVIYVQPHATDGDHCIDFASFASYVARFDDPLSRRFAEHLVLWSNPAGAVEPV